MTDISRKDAITILRCTATEILGANAKGWDNPLIERSYYALDKAISDMEKLEKIEKIINQDCTADVQCASCSYSYRFEDCISYRKVDLIEQIVRGENE